MLRIFLVIDDYNELIYLQTLLKKLGFDVEGLQNPKKYADLSLGFNPQVLIATARGKVVDGLMLAKSIKKRNGIPKVVVLKSHDLNITTDEFEQAGVDMVVETPINPKRLILALATIGSLDENVMYEKFSKMMGLNQTAGQDSYVHQKYDDNGQPVEDLNKLKLDISELIVNKGGGKEKKAPLFPLDKATSDPNLLGQETTKSPASPNEKVKSQVTVASTAQPSSIVVPGTPATAPSSLRHQGSPKIQQRVTPEGEPARQQRFEKWLNEMGPLPQKNFDRDRILEFNKKIRAMPMPDDIQEIEDERKRYVKTLFTNKK